MTARNSIHVPVDRIQKLDDLGLRDLMTRLLHAEASLCGADRLRVTVNAETRAADGGSDAFSPSHSGSSIWLKPVETCWQFKAGTAGRPARLKDEITNPIPAETLKNGGWVVFVTSGAASGEAGRRERLKILQDDALAAGLPTERIEVYTAETLESWCNARPSASWKVGARPAGLETIDEWERDQRHQIEFVQTPKITAAMDGQRLALQFTAGSSGHVHIYGLPGAGKTRHALELCRHADWRELVVYFANAADSRISELIAGVRQEPDVRLIVVVDECNENDIRRLHDTVQSSADRVRLITIGLAPAIDASGIDLFKVEPLSADEMRKLLTGWYPGMPREHQDYLVTLSEGFVKFARLAGEAVAKARVVDARSILGTAEVRVLMGKMLVGIDRRYLYVAAVLKGVGWEQDRADEGKAVAKCLGLDWLEVKQKVKDAHDRYGIAPPAGRLRYISPHPLAIYLALEAWDTYADELKQLPDLLPSDEARDAYDARLRHVLSHPAAQSLSREEIRRFLVLSDFYDRRAARRWAVFSSGAPSLAARGIRRALEAASREERLGLKQSSRRDVIWELVHLAQKAETFFDAAVSLAELAQAENETWANNATGEFLARFQLYLSGTAVPYIERLRVLDHLLARDKDAYGILVAQALTQVGSAYYHGSRSSPRIGESDALEWEPQSHDEDLNSRLAALRMLRALAEAPSDELAKGLVSALEECLPLFHGEATLEPLADVGRAIVRRHPSCREGVRQVTAEALSRAKLRDDFPANLLARLDTICDEFRDDSIEGRLRETLSKVEHDPTAKGPSEEVLAIAGEFVRDPSLIESHWALITSGELDVIWDFGAALGTLDGDAALLPRLVRDSDHRGSDLRAICAYVTTLSASRGVDWADQVVDAYLRETPTDSHLAFELTWRGAPTEAAALRLSRLLAANALPARMVAMLDYGRWADDIPAEQAATIIDQLTAVPDFRGTALSMLAGRIKGRPEEFHALASRALRLVLDPGIIRQGQMIEFNWGQVAKRLVDDHAASIARAIFQTQVTPKSWFMDHHGASDVLRACVARDAHGVWRELLTFLEGESAQRLIIGFPKGLIDELPHQDLLEWAAKDPLYARLLARAAAQAFEDDTSLVADLVARFGADEVGGTLYAAYVSGSWSGPTSLRYARLAERLEAVARSSKREPLRSWARDTAVDLRAQEERERQREAEEDIRD